MREKKYGFIYIWYDRKHKRFYIGCHWGTEDDGYICSSRWMRKAYRRRPKDFGKRKIIQVVHNRYQLLEEEYKWLQMIKDEELGKRYYNLSKKHFGHWSANEETKLTVGQKISASPLRNQRIGDANRGKIISEEAKQKNREATIRQFENKYYKELNRQKSLELWQDPEYRAKQIVKKVGKILSEETRQKMAIARKQYWDMKNG